MIFDYIKSGYQKIKNVLSKTGSMLGGRLRILFSKPLDEETLEKLEELLYEADLGVELSVDLAKKVRLAHKENPKYGPDELLEEVRKEITKILTKQPNQLANVPKEAGPMVVLVVGVNGNGKTTTVAKLTKLFQSEGKKVLIGAADTFRAAATEQLELWSKNLGADIVKGNPKSDPAAVTFDALNAGKARNSDVVIIDTAGRLHTKINLMQELEKIRRSCRKLDHQAPHETLLVLDATTGQNAIDQAKIFNKYTPITGLILTKLDGTAKGGIAISIQHQLGIPIKFIGVGESIEDLEPFYPEAFVNALFE